jgi:hypothetical protein
LARRLPVRLLVLPLVGQADRGFVDRSRDLRASDGEVAVEDLLQHLGVEDQVDSQLHAPCERIPAGLA